MSADMLRRAAALMRERHAAIGGSGARWAVAECEGHNRDSRRTLGQYSLVHDDVSEVAIVRGFSNEREVVADFIASWYPAVALAVADWLETAGADLWAHGPLHCADGCSACDDLLWPPHVRRALAVAAAYLGEPS